MMKLKRTNKPQMCTVSEPGTPRPHQCYLIVGAAVATLVIRDLSHLIKLHVYGCLAST